MGRKVALTAAVVVAVALSVVLVGGQVGRGRFFELGNREPIYIFGNDDFTIENGVISGSGTADDPYIIEGWHIDAPKADYGIYIDHTTAYFVVRDCTVERARLAGVYFNTVENGCVEGARIGLSDTAVYLLNSSKNRLWGNIVADCLYGVVMGARAKHNVIAGNAFLGNGMNGYDPYGDNQWFDDCGGNYWSDYDGVDHDGDGVGDVPYYRVYDAGPLMSPPVDACVEPEAHEEVEASAETPPIPGTDPHAGDETPGVIADEGDGSETDEAAGELDPGPSTEGEEF